MSKQANHSAEQIRSGLRKGLDAKHYAIMVCHSHFYLTPTLMALYFIDQQLNIIVCPIVGSCKTRTTFLVSKLAYVHS